MEFAKFIANFTFCSLLLCLCYGSPPGNSSKSRYNARQYSVDEETFIINQMKAYPGKSLPIWGQDIWINIANNHAEMLQSHPNIFPPRTPAAMAHYFQTIMLSSQGKVKLPDDLLERIPRSKKKKQGGDSGPTVPSETEQQNVASGAVVNRWAHLRKLDMRNRYLPQEDEFIMKFIKNYNKASKLLNGKKIWMEAAEQMKELRESDPSRFPQERSANSLRERFRRMAQKSQKKRLKTTDITTEEEEEEEEDEEEEEEEDVLDLSFKVSHRYTEAENQFIIDEILKPTCTSLYSQSTWKNIKAEHDIKVQSKTSGFDHQRSVGALKKHFSSHLLQQTNEKTPALKKKFPRNLLKSQGDLSSEFYSAGETSQAPSTSTEKSSFWDFEGFEEPDNFARCQQPDDGMVDELVDAPYDIDFDSLKDR